MTNKRLTEGRGASLWRQIFGWTMITVGAAGLLLPLMPAWLCLGAGALMLSPYVRIFRMFSVCIQKRFPRLRGPLKIFRDFKVSRPRAGGKL